MISIIVCNRSAKCLEQLQDNIHSTIGVPYEMVVINNATNNLNIFQAYNLGVAQSKYDILCFAHEDILFHTQDWGKKAIEHLNDPKVGIIGVAGSHYVPGVPGGWWCSGISSGNVIHSIAGKTFLSSWRYKGFSELSVPAVIVDGLWFCIPRPVMNQVRFDDMNFSGFHYYDSDICLQVKKLHYDVRIVFDITIEHFSGGGRDHLWLKNTFRWYAKWKKELPMGTVKLSKPEISRAHNTSELFEQIKKYKPGMPYTIKVWYYYLRWCTPGKILRQGIIKKYPEITYTNPLWNSFKYILKKKLHA